MPARSVTTKNLALNSAGASRAPASKPIPPDHYRVFLIRTFFGDSADVRSVDDPRVIFVGDFRCNVRLDAIRERTPQACWIDAQLVRVCFDGKPQVGLTVDSMRSRAVPSGTSVAFVLRDRTKRGVPVKHDVTSRTANGRRGALSIPKSTIAVTAEELNRLTELRVSPQHSADFFPPAPVLERMVDAALRRIRAQDAESARRLAEFEPGTLAIDSEFELADVFACAIRTAWHGRRALVAIAAGHFDANVLADAVAACEAHGQMQLVAHQDAIAREPSGRKSHDARALEKFKEIEANAAGRATVGELETMTANALRAEGISIAARTVRKARERAGLTARKSNQN